MAKYFYCSLKVKIRAYKQHWTELKATFDIKFYPEQKSKCLKLAKSYLEKKNKKFETGLITLYILLLQFSFSSNCQTIKRKTTPSFRRASVCSPRELYTGVGMDMGVVTRLSAHGMHCKFFTKFQKQWVTL